MLIPSPAAPYHAGDTCGHVSVSVAGSAAVTSQGLPGAGPHLGGCGRCHHLAVALGGLGWAQPIELLPGVLGTAPRNGTRQRVSTPGQAEQDRLLDKDTGSQHNPAAEPLSRGARHRRTPSEVSTHAATQTILGNCAPFWGELHLSPREGATLQLVATRPCAHRPPRS